MNDLCSYKLPVDIVFHPSWWNKHAGIVFDESFFYDPIRRVEDERRMEMELHERFGEFGLGKDYDKDLPQIGAVHLAAGYLLSEMLGCSIDYIPNAAPQVICPHLEGFELDEEKPFQSPAFKKLQKLIEELKARYGYVCGDINWGGVLNLAIDLKGENILMDMILEPEKTHAYFYSIARVVERFFSYIYSETKTTSISVNRVACLLEKPVYIHSECSHTMISEDDYRSFLLPIDMEWSEKYRPYGIHYCGKDPHRHAANFAEIPHLDFLDVGWGGDVKTLREYLPDTFLNIRLNPVELNGYSKDELARMIKERVTQSGNPNLTGICCINMDAEVTDEKVATIFRTAEQCRMEM